jgi:hypothetical protein
VLDAPFPIGKAERSGSVKIWHARSQTGNWIQRPSAAS